MTDYTVINDNAVDADSPVTQSLSRALRDNPLAIAEGSAGSPVIVGLNPNALQTASSSSELLFTNLPALDLIEFELFALLPSSSGAVLRMQVSTNNGSSWSANMNYAKSIGDHASGGTSTAVAEGGFNDSKVDISKTTGGVTQELSGVVKLYNAGSTTLNKSLTWEAIHVGTNIISVHGGAMLSGAGAGSAINAVRFYFSAGNISSGHVAMRGRRKLVTN